MNNIYKRLIAGFIILIIGIITITDYILAIETKKDVRAEIIEENILEEDTIEEDNIEEDTIEEDTIEDNTIEDNTLDNGLLQKKEEILELLGSYTISTNGEEVDSNKKWITEEQKETVLHMLNNSNTLEELNSIIEFLNINSQDGLRGSVTFSIEGKSVTIHYTGDLISSYCFAKGANLNSFDAMEAAGVTSVNYSDDTKTFTLEEEGYYTIRILFSDDTEEFHTILIAQDESALEDMLSEANELINSVSVSYDGKDIMDFEKWVTNTTYFELEQAIGAKEIALLTAALEVFKAELQNGLLEGGRVSRDSLTVTVSEGNQEESEPENRAEIQRYFYAKGVHETYDDLEAAGMTEVTYSEDTRSFIVSEIGIYTIRIEYKNGKSNHLIINLDSLAALKQLMEQVQKRYDETALLEVDDSETGINMSEDQYWVRTSDREALRMAIQEAHEKIESSVNDEGDPISDMDVKELTEALSLFESKVFLGRTGLTFLTLEGMKIIISTSDDLEIKQYQYATGSYDTCEELMNAQGLTEVLWEPGKEQVRVNEQGTYTFYIEYKENEFTGIAKKSEIHKVTIKKQEITQYICYFSEETNDPEEEFRNRLFLLLSN